MVDFGQKHSSLSFMVHFFFVDRLFIIIIINFFFPNLGGR